MSQLFTLKNNENNEKLHGVSGDARSGEKSGEVAGKAGDFAGNASAGEKSTRGDAKSRAKSRAKSGGDAGETSYARLGRVSTIHGSFDTPNFIFCATKASIKAVATHQLPSLGCDIILANTYHLLLTPGPELIAAQGGLHGFMGWQGPMLTDSGGYQIFAMGHGSVAQEVKRVRVDHRQSSNNSTLTPSLSSISEKGAIFRSYFDGSIVELTPERAIYVQCCLGADIIVQLDECTPYHVEREYTARAMERSMRWGDRSLKAFSTKAGEGFPSDFRVVNPQQYIAGVIQGGVFGDLRQQSVDYVYDRDFDSIAVGGSLGRTKEEMHEVVQTTMEMVRRREDIFRPKHRHLLGIGGIDDIFFGVEQGIDTFDCVHPTRIARHGHAIVPFSVLQEQNKEQIIRENMGENTGQTAGKKKSTHQHVLNLKNARYKEDSQPLDAGSSAKASHYTRAYLHHLLKVKEISALNILSEHNVAQMTRLLRDIRRAIANGTLRELRLFWLGY